MKRCPTCNATFEDEINFCLVDGAVLSTDYDPQATRLTPPPRSTDPSPTAVLFPPAEAPRKSPTVIPTIAAPPPQLYSEKPRFQRPEKRSGWVAPIIGIGILVAAVITAVAIFMLSGKSNLVKDQPRPTPTKSSAPAGAAASKESACFGTDSGAGRSDRAGHYSWGQQHDVEAIEKNLLDKADLLFHCPTMNEDGLANAFADISVFTAKAVPDASCFGGDAGVISTDRDGHKNAFPNAPDRKEQLLKNLKWKMGAALKCLHQSEQASYFADVSVLIANAAE